MSSSASPASEIGAVWPANRTAAWRCFGYSFGLIARIIPAFELSQDSDFLTIVIKVPYVRVSEFDIYFEGKEFKFYAKPYFLRLALPGKIVEDRRERASYDDKGAENEEEEEEEFDWQIEQIPYDEPFKFKL